MRPEVQLSRSKIVLSEAASRIWIFLNFFELPRDLFRFFQFFFSQRLLTFTMFENKRCQCH